MLRLRELTRLLAHDALADPALVDHVVAETQGLLDADAASFHKVVSTERGLDLEFNHCAGGLVPETMEHFCRLLQTMGQGVVAYDPSRLPPRQRNVVWNHRRHPAWFARYLRTPVVTEVYPRAGLAGLEEMRVLLCDGPVLLGWFGVLKQRRFTERDERLLGEVARPFRTWLTWRQRLGGQQADAGALPAALEAIGVAAFLLDARGRVRHANSAGIARLEQDRRSVLEDLAACLRKPEAPGPYAVTRVRPPGSSEQYLCVERSTAAAKVQIDRSAAAWRLTPREAQVLGLLTEGLPNRTIAETLGCSVRTVELHVSRILVKGGAESRTALVARVLEGG